MSKIDWLRRAYAQFFTPESVVACCYALLAGALPNRPRIVDPACGDGAFLGYAAERGIAPAAALTGCDIDSALVAALVAGGMPGVRCVDGLAPDSLAGASFDLVIGNPPFGVATAGGGRAELLLTGEEILDAGIQIVAQPPGKKNSSIHLLSGGEKALTAIALVFAMFQLNPAPFCMLDEVDAPLDDTNTERYANMVKRMSAQTQFIFISHSKITMEFARQLVGVTMQEQGVSRVVEVDIEEALRLAEPSAA